MTAGARRQCVPRSHPALAGHFPGAPIVPGAWMLTLIEAECRKQFGARLRIAGIRHARFRKPVAPDRPFCIRLTLLAPGEMAFAVEDDGIRLVEGKLVVDGAR